MTWSNPQLVAVHPGRQGSSCLRGVSGRSRRRDALRRDVHRGDLRVFGFALPLLQHSVALLRSALLLRCHARIDVDARFSSRWSSVARPCEIGSGKKWGRDGSEPLPNFLFPLNTRLALRRCIIVALDARRPPLAGRAPLPGLRRLPLYAVFFSPQEAPDQRRRRLDASPPAGTSPGSAGFVVRGSAKRCAPGSAHRRHPRDQARNAKRRNGRLLSSFFHRSADSGDGAESSRERQSAAPCRDENIPPRENCSNSRATVHEKTGK
ncbi:MAG: hypothetical protein BJ554DRAFT_171 [Olpidium bornovanus]|uniref:Uncharacterized protein n=1 Tax=Olpidium bornovanus TaxID=278681 RepID=A0A8H8DIC1_9FUNG|nr:MAG: hypothetical protein BJ554DRAFT_171 [Olpidium bornovanus]